MASAARDLPESDRWSYIAQMLGCAIGVADRLALSRTEAAERLGVSPDFFDAYIAPELRVIRRGRRQLYPLHDLILWLEEAAGSLPKSRSRATRAA